MNPVLWNRMGRRARRRVRLARELQRSGVNVRLANVGLLALLRRLGEPSRSVVDRA